MAHFYYLMSASMFSDEELLRRCANGGDSDDWRDFVRRFHKLIAIVILRISDQYGSGNKDVADELVQETFLKLCANKCAVLKAFDPRHPNAIYGFLRVVAANVAHDHFRALMASKRGGRVMSDADLEESGILETVPGDGAQSVERTVLVREVHASLGDVLPGDEHARERLIFRLYFQQGLTAAAIAALPQIGLSVKGVESVLLRAVKLVREHLQRRESTPSRESSLRANPL